MKKKVLCIAGWWPSGGSYTGIFIKEHIRAIQLIHDVQVVYLEVHKGPLRIAPLQVSSKLEDGLLVHRLTVTTPLRRFGMIAFLARIAYSRFISRLHTAQKFELIHIHVRTEITEQIKSVARKSDLPLVITEHNSFYHLGIRKLPITVADRLRRSIRKWFDDDRIVSLMPVSKDLGQVLHTEYGVPSNKITIVPNVASEEFVPAEAPSNSPFRILLAAVWRPPKDHDVFIRAIKLLPTELIAKISIEWVGYGPEYQMIMDRCRKELPHVQIAFPGAMPKAMLARS
ncbi:MAG: glycosyltransferase, partial [Bacteroidota bacterium]|nr:glycosyltransferase [Bacteroidota bacterium]